MAIIFSVPGWLPNRGVDNTQFQARCSDSMGMAAQHTQRYCTVWIPCVMHLQCHATRAEQSKSKSKSKKQLRSSEPRSRTAFAARLLSTVQLLFVRTSQPLMQRHRHPFHLCSRPPCKGQSSSRLMSSSSPHTQKLAASPVGMPRSWPSGLKAKPVTHPMSPASHQLNFPTIRSI
jgi:hypothetical protein